jgi:hypothetical protein
MVLRMVAVRSTGEGSSDGGVEGDGLAASSDGDGPPAEHAVNARTTAAADQRAFFIAAEYGGRQIGKARASCGNPRIRVNSVP